MIPDQLQRPVALSVYSHASSHCLQRRAGLLQALKAVLRAVQSEDCTLLQPRQLIKLASAVKALVVRWRKWCQPSSKDITLEEKQAMAAVLTVFLRSALHDRCCALNICLHAVAGDQVGASAWSGHARITMLAFKAQATALTCCCLFMYLQAPAAGLHTCATCDDGAAVL